MFKDAQPPYRCPRSAPLLIGTFVFEQTAPALATRGHPRLTKAGNGQSSVGKQRKRCFCHLRLLWVGVDLNRAPLGAKESHMGMCRTYGLIASFNRKPRATILRRSAAETTNPLQKRREERPVHFIGKRRAVMDGADKVNDSHLQ